MHAQAQAPGIGRTAVVGAGALGHLYAGLLAHAAPGKVTLFTRRADACQALRRQVSVLRAGSELRHDGLDVRLAADAKEGTYDLVLVLVSTYDTAAVAPFVARLLRPDGICLTLQNGLGNQPLLAAAAGAQRALAGATSFAAHLERPGVVRVDGEGLTWLPAVPAHLAWWPALLGRAGLEPRSMADPEQLLWHKAALGTNGYVALALAAPAGQVVRTEAGRSIALRASQEITRLAVASGIDLEEADVTAALRQVWDRCSPDTRSSLYTDYLAGRRTEVDERLGELLQRARALQVPVPTLEALHLLAQARLQLASVAKGDMP